MQLEGRINNQILGVKGLILLTVSHKTAKKFSRREGNGNNFSVHISD